MKTGTGMFYAVGVGPGDPAWMTRQACDVLGFCPVIAAPRSASGEMPALEVARGAVDLSRKSIVPLKFTAARARSAQKAEYVRAASSIARVLDAGFLRVSDRKAVRVMENRLHVTCLSAGEEAPRVEGGEAAAGFFPREWFVSFRFAPEVSLPEARLSVQRRWQAAFPSGECLIEAMSPDFDAVAVPDGGEGICPWLPPHDTDTPIAAFERGAAWAKEVCAR